MHSSGWGLDVKAPFHNKRLDGSRADPIVTYPPRIVATPRLLSAIVGSFSTVTRLTFRPPHPS